jgi:hypothetical protein
MLSGTGYPSGENYPVNTGMELFFYPHAGTGNPTGKILRVRVRVRVGTTRQVRTRCHLEAQWRWREGRAGDIKTPPTVRPLPTEAAEPGAVNGDRVGPCLDGRIRV